MTDAGNLSGPIHQDVFLGRKRKAKDRLAKLQERVLLLKAGEGNPNHDEKGRFSSDESAVGSTLEDNRIHSSHSATMKEYTGENGRYANAIARGQRDKLGGPQKAIGDRLKASMDAMFSNLSPINEPITLHRGMAAYAASSNGFDTENPQSMVGKRFADDGWTSTTKSAAIAGQFAGVGQTNAVIFNIQTKPGIKAINVERNSSHINATKEKEVLLDRGSKFLITGVKVVPGISRRGKDKVAIKTIHVDVEHEPR